MVVASLDWAFLRTFVHVREHMGFDIFEYLTTVRIGAAAFLPKLFAAKVILAAEQP